MSIADIGQKAKYHMKKERRWTMRAMAGDSLYNDLPLINRNYLHLGRIFVAWKVVGGKPAISSMLKVDRLGINNTGLTATMTITRPSIDTMDMLRIDNRPERLLGHDVYLWIPYYAEVRSTPVLRDDDSSPLRCSVPVLIKHRNNSAEGQHDGCDYFASQSEFNMLWPEHAF